MYMELPTIFSDDEIERQLNARQEPSRYPHDRLASFGVRPASVPTDGRPESCIEQKFPHIAAKLRVVWPSEACSMYLSDLIVNTREGTRQGFPQDVLEDLLLLYALNEMLLRAAKSAQRIRPRPATYSAATQSR